MNILFPKFLVFCSLIFAFRLKSSIISSMNLDPRILLNPQSSDFLNPRIFVFLVFTHKGPQNYFLPVCIFFNSTEIRTEKIAIFCVMISLLVDTWPDCNLFRVVRPYITQNSEQFIKHLVKDNKGYMIKKNCIYMMKAQYILFY